MSDTRVIIAVDQSRESSSDDLDLPERCRILKLANGVTYDRMDKAISDLERVLQLPTTESVNPLTQPQNPHAPANSGLIDVLMGKRGPSQPSILATPLEYFDTSLNDSQKEAVKMCLEAEEVGLVHGPPGTGKTHTLVEVVRQLIARDQRVLVCGASNLAVDNLLERLAPHGIPLTRIGHPARVLSSLHSATLDSQAAASDESQIAKDVKEELENALNTLAGKGKGGKGKRPRGAERREMWDEVKELRKEYRKRENVVVKNVMNRAKIVLATCHSAGGRQLLNAQFDVLIIDEATQALEAVCWIPILKAKKLILAGDPMQLPPTILTMDKDRNQKSKTKSTSAKSKTKQGAKSGGSVDKPTGDSPKAKEEHESCDEATDRLAESETGDAAILKSEPEKKEAVAKAPQTRSRLRPSHSLEVTLFDRLEEMYGAEIKRLLNVQYRMHEAICQFPSTALYHSKLVSHPSGSSHLLRDLPTLATASIPVDGSDVLDVPVIFFDTAGCEYFERVGGDDNEGNGKGDEEGSRRNENEASVVKIWVGKLVEAGIQPSQIAVITPYQAQVTALTSLLRPKMPEIEIGSVDGMQGREKEAVVLSLVRSNDKREVGFLKEKRRLNVAMTRARRHLCIVGDSSTVSYGSPYLKSWMDWLEQNAEVRFAGLD
ncbi:hypothetical protein FRB94_008851 [Tulasnella sp. JGI-2019a]|nr:hypothetical protein FRB94_008851 [Tulasnella sp. JGI-2019a]